MKTPKKLERAFAFLRGKGLEYPEAVEEFPWGETALKVRGKVFGFLALEGRSFSMSVKLPKSNMAALMFPFASPTGYGLGKSGWVTAKFEGAVDVPTDLLEEWLDESYRTIAPKRVVASLDAGEETPTRKKTKRAAPKK